ncbi:MAG TPA: carotenoid oxygenase family protein [Candidatus Angelobacter sp.]|nr:carotenoid oxygenase family protein [Candidatus Angelobacter sp.]
MNLHTFDSLKIAQLPTYPITQSLDFAPGIEAAFPDQFEECDCKVEAVGAPLPDFLRGTYYLNGPARFGLNGLKYRHWLDGDGMVTALRFEQDSIHLTSRYVRSRKFMEEQSAGQPIFRTFGTSFANSRLNRAGNGLESPVNVSVYPFGKSLLAFGEQGLPWELDPVTLETRGQFTFNGRLNDASPFSAHPKFDSDTGEMFNFGIFFSAQAPKLYFYCFGPEGLRYRKPVALDYPCSVHDFSLSKNYAISYLSPYLLDVSNLLQNGQTVMDSLRWQPEHGSRILVLSRKTGEIVASLPVGNRYCLHLINSFEEGSRLTIDILEFDEPLYGHYQPVPHLFEKVSPGGPVRFVIDLHKKEVIERTALPYSQAPDFPSIDPRCFMESCNDLWMLGISHAGQNGRKFFDQLVHASWTEPYVSDVYQSPHRRYLGGEPVFVGSPDSEDGLIMCQEFDAETEASCFLIFEAHRVAQGPIARIALEHPLYLGFHAVFVPVEKLQICRYTLRNQAVSC